MQHFRSFFTSILVIILCTTLSTEALAKKPVRPAPGDEPQTTLSKKDALNLAKLYLDDFQAVDPDITVNHLKGYILNLNTTDQAVIDAAMQDYLASLEPAPTNQAPTISGSPVTTTTEGENYLFVPSASDPNGDSLTFSIVNKPAWASFDSASGTLSGIPASGSAGLYSGITISVSDGELSDNLASFAIDVVAPQPINQAPTISGVPTSIVIEGESYFFLPSVSDPDGDSLSFSITNKPAWASFDSATGTLSGTPASGSAGLYSGISIIVSDGELSASLDAFTIQVEEQAAVVSATLRWTAPSLRADGSVLSLGDIEGYRIYMGDTEASLTAVMDINDQSVNEYTLSNIPQGNHYFAITAFDIAGNESGLSNIVLNSSY